MYRFLVILGAFAAAAALVAVLAASAPLATFNALTPKDNARRVAASISYGAGPRRMRPDESYCDPWQGQKKPS